MADSSVPRFDPRGSLFDTSTYFGRVRYFSSLVDPRNALITDAELDSAKTLLQQHKEGRLPAGTTDASLWRAKGVVDAVCHPDTGEKIPLAFRMSMFMPANLPISAGMILSGTGTAQLVFQWLNQSYNAGFNYFNRSISSSESGVAWASIATSYTVATGTAVAMAAGLGRVVDRMQARVASSGASPTVGMKIVSRALPWFAVASAGAANAVAMRYKDALEGVSVEDASGRVYGVSRTAGWHALGQIALTRVVLPIPILLIPPFVLDAARSSRFLGGAMARSRPVSVLVELAVIAAHLQAALPFAVALFPQRCAVPASALEPEFRARTDAEGRVIDTFYYNKGV